MEHCEDWEKKLNVIWWEKMEKLKILQSSAVKQVIKCLTK